MQRKLLLAFGAHNRQSERPFFRKAVAPSLDEHVLTGGKKAVVVYEFVYYEAVLAQLEPEDKRKIVEDAKFRADMLGRLQRILTDRLEKKFNDEMAASFNVGHMFSSEFVYFNGGASPIFGIEEDIIRINSQRPNSVICVTEPHDAEVILRELMVQYYCSRRTREGMFAAMRAFAESLIIRDKKVVSLADKITGDDPETLVVVVRGIGHRGMRNMFDATAYNIDCRDSGFPIDFASDANEDMYTRRLSDEELLRYSRLQGHFNDKFYALAEAHYPSLEGAIRLAREYALRMEAASTGAHL